MDSSASPSSPGEPEPEGLDTRTRDLRRENAKLSNDNRSLSNQLVALRQQFTEALSISQNVDTVLAQSTQTAKELASVKTQRDDLQSRLQSALRANQELKRTIDSLRRQSPHDEHHDPHEQFDSELAKVRQQLEPWKADHAQLQQQLETIFQTSSHYFGTPIDCVESFLTSFDRWSRHPQDEFQNQNQLHTLTRKLKRCRAEITESRGYILTLETDRDRIGNRLDQTIKNRKANMNNLKHEIENNQSSLRG
jgi:chromosome segregation ATPase